MGKFVVGGDTWVGGERSDPIYEQLHAAGLLPHKPTDVARVVIDLQAGQPARVHYVTYGDRETVDTLVARLLEGDAREDEDDGA